MDCIKIGDKAIGEGHPVFVIAEAGANWHYCNDPDKNYKQACRLIDIASEAGADAIKFQVYKADKLYIETAGKTDYMKGKKSIYDIFKEMEIPYGWLQPLKEYCDKKGIIFFATPFDEESAMALESIKVAAYKIASYTISHFPLIKLIASFNKPIIFSTGASDLDDIDKAINIIKKEGNSSIAVMQCTAKYPAPLETINLRVIPSLKQRYNIPIGLSDHSRQPYIAPLGAVALGANLIEKHFTTSNTLDGIDHAFAITGDELRNLVSSIRSLEKAMGGGRKEIQPPERELYDFCRRKIYAIKDIKADELLDNANIRVLRSGRAEKGLDPLYYDKLIGKKARVNIKKNSPIILDLIK